MNISAALGWIREMLWTAVTAGSPVVVSVAVIGLLMAILQAATQVNDAAVPFAAKAVGVFVSLILFGAWMLTQMSDFAIAAFTAIGQVTAH